MKKITAVLYRDLDFEWRWFVMHKRLTVGESMKGFRLASDARSNFEIVTGLIAPTIKADQLEVTTNYLVELRHFERVEK